MEYNRKEALRNNTSSSGNVFILPNGQPWNGAVHKMADNTWMTGSKHSKTSVHVYPMPSFIDFPIEGNLATQDPLNDVFEFVASSSESIETSISNLTTRITEIKQIIERESGNADAIINKLEQLRDDNNIQTESNGSGSIIETFNTPLTLSLEMTINHSTAVSSVSFASFSDKESFVYHGNIETGAAASAWNRITTENITAEMISRRNILLEEINSDEEYSFTDEFRTIPDNYLIGFSGKITLNLNKNVIINKIVINSQSDIKISNLTYNESEIDQLNGTNYLNNLSTPSTDINKVSMDLEYIYPVPFNSYAFEEDGIVTDLVNDLETIPNINFTGDNRIYQKTRLEMGPIYLLSEVYSESTEIVSEVYTCKSGTLNSIFILVDEDIPESFTQDTYIDYFLTINGNDYQITPQNKEGEHPSTFFINSKLGDSARASLASSQNVGFLEIEPTINWTIKYRLKRPVSITQETPALNSINLFYTTSKHEGVL